MNLLAPFRSTRTDESSFGVIWVEFPTPDEWNGGSRGGIPSIMTSPLRTGAQRTRLSYNVFSKAGWPV